MTKSEMKSAITIDRNRLDIECETQADRYFDAAVGLAEAKENYAALSAKLDLLESDLAVQVKQDPSAFGLESVSEKIVFAVVKQQKEYQELLTAVQAAKHDVDIHGVFVEALDQRKRMLQELVALHGQSYFAVPVVSGDVKKEVERRSKTSARIPMTPQKQPQ